MKGKDVKGKGRCELMQIEIEKDDAKKLEEMHMDKQCFHRQQNDRVKGNCRTLQRNMEKAGVSFETARQPMATQEVQIIRGPERVLTVAGMNYKIDLVVAKQGSFQLDNQTTAPIEWDVGDSLVPESVSQTVGGARQQIRLQGGALLHRKQERKSTNFVV